jgi:hypothetical protein
MLRQVLDEARPEAVYQIFGRDYLSGRRWRPVPHTMRGTRRTFPRTFGTDPRPVSRLGGATHQLGNASFGVQSAPPLPGYL